MDPQGFVEHADEPELLPSPRSRRPTLRRGSSWAANRCSSSRLFTQARGAILFRIGVWCVVYIHRSRKLTRERLDPQEREKLVKLFFKVSSHDPLVTVRQVHSLVFATGQIVLESQLADALVRTGFTPGSFLTLPQFLGVMEILKRKHVIQATATDTESAFMALTTSECDVDLSVGTLLAICYEYHLSQDVADLIAEADADGSGRIDFQEFYDLLEPDKTEKDDEAGGGSAQKSQIPAPPVLRRATTLLRHPLLAPSQQQHALGVAVTAGGARDAVGERDEPPKTAEDQLLLIEQFLRLQPNVRARSAAERWRERVEKKRAERKKEPQKVVRAPKKPTAKAVAFQSSARMFYQSEPLGSLPKPALKDPITPRPHRHEAGPLPEGRRYAVATDDALEAQRKAKEEKMLQKQQQQQSVVGDLAQGNHNRCAPSFTEFNPFLGPTSPNLVGCSAGAATASSESAMALPKSLLMAAESHPEGGAYLPWLADKLTALARRRRCGVEEGSRRKDLPPRPSQMHPSPRSRQPRRNTAPAKAKKSLSHRNESNVVCV